MTTRQTIEHLTFIANGEMSVRDFRARVDLLTAQAGLEYGELTLTFDTTESDGEPDEIFLYVSGHPKHALIERRSNTHIGPCAVCDFPRESDVHK